MRTRHMWVDPSPNGGPPKQLQKVRGRLILEQGSIICTPSRQINQIPTGDAKCCFLVKDDQNIKSPSGFRRVFASHGWDKVLMGELWFPIETATRFYGAPIVWQCKTSESYAKFDENNSEDDITEHYDYDECHLPMISTIEEYIAGILELKKRKEWATSAPNWTIGIASRELASSIMVDLHPDPAYKQYPCAVPMKKRDILEDSHFTFLL
ncbi:hypothetical protein Pelo_12983 [Pelomyxa schiedti]|nr:hypothetical protein Pelo_12983 [Pelomyxa schiedti]